MKKFNKTKFMVAPHATSAISAYAYLSQLQSSLEFTDYLSEMKRRSEAIKAGDMSLAEDFLISQASALDAMFNSLAVRATNYLGVGNESSMKAMEVHLRLALRAQSQCRTTLEALSEIKNPRSITVTKQANFADQQVVNNGTMNTGSTGDTSTPACAGNTEKESNELLGEGIEDERMDTRASQTTSGINQTMETMGEIDRGKDKQR